MYIHIHIRTSKYLNIATYIYVHKYIITIYFAIFISFCKDLHCICNAATESGIFCILRQTFIKQVFFSDVFSYMAHIRTSSQKLQFFTCLWSHVLSSIFK